MSLLQWIRETGNEFPVTDLRVEWLLNAVAFRSTDVRLRGEKTRKEEPPGSNRKSKRRKFTLMEEDWGVPSTTAPRSNVLLVGLQPAITGSREPGKVVTKEPGGLPLIYHQPVGGRKGTLQGVPRELSKTKRLLLSTQSIL